VRARLSQRRSFFSALHQVLGATVVTQPRFEADGALDAIERHRVTTFSWRRLCFNDWSTLSRKIRATSHRCAR